MNIYSRITGAAIVATLLAALSIAGCGGSGGGNAAQPPPPPPTGGITRTGVAIVVGPITGFSSVIVNGNTYDTSAAIFSKDGLPSTQAEFEVGEMVLVTGTIPDDNSSGSADTVEFEDNVEGPVTSVNADGTITVMGQTVSLPATLSIDDSCPASLDDASIVAVEVSGIVDMNGVIDASRIECKFNLADVGDFEVNGIVSGHDDVLKTFMINALQVDYTSAAVDNFPTGVINNGDPVEAKGTDFDSTVDPDVLTATRVEFKGARFADDEGDHMEIEGFITGFVSATEFSITSSPEPIPVTTIPGTTVFEGGFAADLGDNLKIEVEGEFDEFGVLNATKIEIKTSTNVRVTGQVDGVVANVVRILDIAVNTAPTMTRFEDKSDAPVDPFGVGNINTDDYIEARGQELPVGQITAFLIERDDFDPNSDDTELRGFVEVGGVNEPDSLTVLNVTILTSGAKFIDSRGDTEVAFSDPADFWAAVGEGSLVDAKGTETGVRELTATEVELEME